MQDRRTIKNVEIENYFLFSLQAGRKDKLKICLMTHNSEWSYYQRLEKHFDNLTIDLYGSGIAYLNIPNKEEKIDYDVIILNSNSYYNTQEKSYLEEMSEEISKMNNKKVTFAYSFYTPNKDNEQFNHEEAIIFTYEKNSIAKEHLVEENNENLKLLDIVMNIHDHFNTSKVKQKSKKSSF